MLDYSSFTHFLPMSLKNTFDIKTTVNSSSCAALVKNVNGLKLEFTCILWNNDLATLVKKDFNAWVDTQTAVLGPNTAYVQQESWIEYIEPLQDTISDLAPRISGSSSLNQLPMQCNCPMFLKLEPPPIH